ncbi:MAG: molybdopterin-guanine dinucleotide biosynthesis protein MobA, partial [Verrucomicrobia bacterium]|nr:molybdopterin-guanine dinucleotide biosynthesis protein MobA [Verrucomicrobiota bacterium]
FVGDATIASLLQQRNPLKVATAYTSAHDGLPEPLCAIYEPHARSRLLQFMAVGYHCPRKVLTNSNVALLELEDARALDNVNHPAEYAAAIEALKG